jgi:hypothetical protein
MEPRAGGNEWGEKNPIRNFCWPLSNREKEECIQGYEDVFEEEHIEKEQAEAEGKSR